MGMKYGTGWREREAAGKAKIAERISAELAANLKIAADRLQAERDAAIAFAAEQERRRQETLCACPTCSGTGRTTVEAAAQTIVSVEYTKAKNVRPETRHYAQANAGVIAQNAPVPAAPIAPVIATEDDAAGSDDEALAAIQAKPGKVKRHVSHPFLDGSD